MKAIHEEPWLQFLLPVELPSTKNDGAKTMSDAGYRQQSGFGEDLFSPGRIETDDVASSEQPPVRLDQVAGSPGSSGNGTGGLPDHLQLRTASGGDSVHQRSSDDPVHFEHVGLIGRADDHGSGVVEASGIDPIDGVGPSQPVGTALSDGQITGQGARVEHDQESNERNGSPEPLHSEQSRDIPADVGRSKVPNGSGSGEHELKQASPLPIVDPDEEFSLPRSLKLLAGVFVLFIAGAMAFVIFEPIQVLPRIRLAPGYALMSQDGSSVSSEAARGTVTLYNFAPTDCTTECEDMNRTMADVQAWVQTDLNLGEVDFRLVTIALDPVEDPDQLVEAASRSGSDGVNWIWVGGDQTTIETVAGTGFRRFFETQDNGSIRFDPGYVLVDGNGVVRGDYRYQTLADDSDKLSSHLKILADEIRYANGATAIAYEAAHLFLCYP